jgi:hypothetical protein
MAVVRWAAGAKYSQVMEEWEGTSRQSKRQHRAVSLFDRI